MGEREEILIKNNVFWKADRRIGENIVQITICIIEVKQISAQLCGFLPMLIFKH